MISSLVAKLLLQTLTALKTHFSFNDDVSSNKQRLLLSYDDFGAKNFNDSSHSTTTVLIRLNTAKTFIKHPTVL